VDDAEALCSLDDALNTAAVWWVRSRSWLVDARAALDVCELHSGDPEGHYAANGLYTQRISFLRLLMPDRMRQEPSHRFSYDCLTPPLRYAMDTRAMAERHNLHLPVHEKLLAGLRSYASLRLLTQVASWGTSIYVIRHVGNGELGRYAVALVVFNYLATAYDGTLLEALIQRPPATSMARRAVFSLMTVIGLILALITAGASAVIGRLVGDAAVPPLILGMALALALSSLCVLPQATLAREMNFSRLASIGAFQAACVTIATVALAWRGFGAWALVSGQIVGVVVRVVLLNASSLGIARPTFRVGEAMEYLRVGGVLFADNLLWRWYTSLDTFLLGRWAGTRLLGFYSLAQQLAELPLEKIATVVNDVSLPAYAHLSSDRKASGALLLETVRTHATVGFPLYWGFAATAGSVVSVLFGNEWHLTIFPLAALALVAPLRLIGSSETPAMTGLGCPKVLLKTKLIIAPCMSVALLIGCRFGGINGAAMAWVAMFPLCLGLSFRYVVDAAGVPYRRVLGVIRGPAMAAALMGTTVVGWQRAVNAWYGPPWLALASSIAIGVVAYAGALRMLDPEAFRLAWVRLGRVAGLGQATLVQE
jgi:O-antigen/teichoic acid export membrane protein